MATPDNLRRRSTSSTTLLPVDSWQRFSDAAIVEGTKVSLVVGGEEFVAKGDVLVKPGFRGIYPYGLKKDEQLPALEEGQEIAFNGATCTKDQTKPPARYSAGPPYPEMEKLGLGTKSTRHSIIERLYTVKYVQNDPIEPSQLGMAVCDALDKFAPPYHPSRNDGRARRRDGQYRRRSETKTEGGNQFAQSAFRAAGKLASSFRRSEGRSGRRRCC